MLPFLYANGVTDVCPTVETNETAAHRGNIMKYIAYYRVSTRKQGQSGLGLDAQRAAVRAYLKTENRETDQAVPSPNGGISPHGDKTAPFMEFTEIESGKRNDRPRLDEAMQACRVYKATLVIARLDRLARNAHFLLGLKESGIDFVCADMPNANRLTVGIMAMMAEEVGRTISANTKSALKAAKARGVVMGGFHGYAPSDLDRKRSAESKEKAVRARARDLAPIVRTLQATGAESLRAIAAGLNAKGVPTATGKGQWSARQVQRVLERL
jgi:DNA invertase Pin-like site-specific DNA recombinase